MVLGLCARSDRLREIQSVGNILGLSSGRRVLNGKTRQIILLEQGRIQAESQEHIAIPGISGDSQSLVGYACKRSSRHEPSVEWSSEIKTGSLPDVFCRTPSNLSC